MGIQRIFHRNQERMGKAVRVYEWYDAKEQKSMKSTEKPSNVLPHMIKMHWEAN